MFLNCILGILCTHNCELMTDKSQVSTLICWLQLDSNVGIMPQISNIFTSVLGWSISISRYCTVRDDHWVKVSEMYGGDRGYWDLRQWIGSQGDICVCDYCLLYEYWQEIVVSHIDHKLMNTWMACHESITVVNSTEKAVRRWFFGTFTISKPQFLNMLNFF